MEIHGEFSAESGHGQLFFRAKQVGKGVTEFAMKQADNWGLIVVLKREIYLLIILFT